MKYGMGIMILLLTLIVFGQISSAEEKKQDTARDDRFDTTSKELKSKYQTVNASIFASIISPEIYPGAFSGPGYYLGMNGPLVSIGWVERSKDEQLETKATRYIPIGSIISVDKPVQLSSNPDRYVVYYKGPFDETEFFIFPDIKGEQEKESAYQRFIYRWKLYLLAQEPSR